MVYYGSKGGIIPYDGRVNDTRHFIRNFLFSLTCRTKLLEVVSEEVLPSERLKRLFLFAHFP